MSKVVKSFICRGCLNPVTRAGCTSVDIAASAKVGSYWISFYRAMLCMRGTSHRPVSVCLSLSVSVSVTSRSSTKTAKHRIK